MGEIVDLFAGPGGWSEALRLLGRSADEIGIEYEPNACKTRAAAGHRTLQADVSTIDERQYLGLEGLIASPPCQAFSAAGKGAARNLLPELLASIRARRWNDRADPDPRVWLIVNLGRWLERLTPRWIAMEQVPSVLPIWQAYAELLRGRGYSVWTGTLLAADFGVPQTRQRAILIASLDRVVHPPEPTHARDPIPSLFGELLRWVTMFEALGWGMTERAGSTLAPGTKSGGPSAVGGSGARRGLDAERAAGRWVQTRGDSGRSSDEFDAAELPSRTITGRSDSWIVSTGMNTMSKSRDPEDMEPYTRSVHEPAPTVSTMSGSQWTIGPPDHRPRAPQRWKKNRDEDEPADDAEPSSETIKLSVRDALILQSFRPDYPVQGTKTKQFEQRSPRSSRSASSKH